MSQTTPEKYSADEWDYIRMRFLNSILNGTEIAKLGQNVGISWPFKGSDENPSKYIEFEFEELNSVPGLIGKKSRIKALMDILRETLAFDDPFGEMVDTVEAESLEDNTFERILVKLEIDTDYPAEYMHFSDETKQLLHNEDVKTLMECVHYGQELANDALIGGDLKTFLNGLAHKDELTISKHIPFRRGMRGLHLAEAIGLIGEYLNEPTKLNLLKDCDITLSEEEEQILSSVSEDSIEASLKVAQEQLVNICKWFTEETEELKEIFSSGGAPERFFILINEPRRERIAVQLAKMEFFVGEEKKKTSLFSRIFGR